MVSSRQLPNLQATRANFHSECDQMSQISVISITCLLSMRLSPMTSSYGATDTLSLQTQHKASSQCRGRDRRLLQGKLRTGTCLSLACCIPTVNRRPYSEVEKSGLLAEHLQPPVSACPWHGAQMFPLHLIISFYTCQGLTLRWVMLKLRFQLLSLFSVSPFSSYMDLWVQAC